jgi:molecular chaperone GrpE
MTQKNSDTENNTPLEVLQQEIVKLKEQLQEAERAKLRALADLENFRRRESESRTNWSRTAVADWVQSFLPSLQELLLGAEHTSDTDIQKVIEKFMGKLGEQGLSKITPTVGDEINTDEHAVLMTAEGEPGTVVQVLEPGWKLGDNVILPAKISGAPIS